MKILVRADSAFARDWLMSWCEENSVDYLFGLARNGRLEREIEATFEALEVERAQGESEESIRRFVELRYQTLNTWSREQRVVAKAELMKQGRNPRFVVTSLGEELDGREIYEDLYQTPFRGQFLSNSLREGVNKAVIWLNQEFVISKDRSDSTHFSGQIIERAEKGSENRVGDRS